MHVKSYRKTPTFDMNHVFNMNHDFDISKIAIDTDHTTFWESISIFVE